MRFFDHVVSCKLFQYDLVNENVVTKIIKGANKQKNSLQDQVPTWFFKEHYLALIPVI